MKKLRMIALCILLLIPILSGCYGYGGDWDYPLPNSYVVLRADDINIVFGKQESANSVDEVIPRHIAAFSFNKRFVGIKRFPIEGHSKVDNDKTLALIENAGDDSFEYYLIDTEQDSILGPFDAAGFDAACEMNEVSDLCDWIETAALDQDSPGVHTYD